MMCGSRAQAHPSPEDCHPSLLFLYPKPDSKTVSSQSTSHTPQTYIL